MHQVSHDLTLAEPLELHRPPAHDGAADPAGVPGRRGRQCGVPRGLEPRTKEILDLWAEVLELLQSDRAQLLADRLDWVAKLTILDGYRRRDGLDWSAHRLAAVDLQYADTRPERGLAHRLEQRGSLRRLTTDAGGGAARWSSSADGHPRLVPRRVRPPLRRPGGGSLVGLGHLRRARDAARWSGCRPGPAARHAGARVADCWIAWAASASWSPP